MTSEITTLKPARLVEDILTKLDDAYRVLPPEQQALVQSNLMQVWQGIVSLSNTVANNDETLRTAVAVIEGLRVGVNEMTKQRDLIADEYAQLAKALDRMDLKNPVILAFWGKVYENAMENHNAAFWESLPYDMADVLGEDWNHMEASTLYELITSDEEETDIDPDKLRAFRAALLKLVQEFDEE